MRGILLVALDRVFRPNLSIQGPHKHLKIWTMSCSHSDRLSPLSSKALLMAMLLIRIYIVPRCTPLCESNFKLSTSRISGAKANMTISCTILLHDPHADVRKSGCISALKILTAARATLDLIYAVWSTSYDITLMDLSCTVSHIITLPFSKHRIGGYQQFCWLMAGRVLVRFLSAAQEANSQDQIATLRTELEFVQ